MKFEIEISHIDNDKSRLWIEEKIHSFIYNGFDSLYCDGELINEPNINIKHIEE